MADFEERSALWNIAATGSLAGGVAYGMRGRWGAAREAFRFNPLVSPLERAALTQPSFTNYTLSKGIESATQQNMINLLNTISPNRAKQEVAAAAYASLMSSGKVSRGAALEVYRGVQELGTTVETAYGAALAAIEKQAGDAGVFAKRIEGLFSEGEYRTAARANVWSNLVATSPGFGGARTGTILSEVESSAASDIRKRLNVFEEWSYHRMEDVVAGRPTQTTMAVGRLAGTEVAIPLSETGLTYGGAGLTARYPTRKVWHPNRQELVPYHEYYVELLENNLADAQTASQRRRAVVESTKQIMASINERDAAMRAGAVWSLPESIGHSGVRAQAALTRLQAVPHGDILDTSGRVSQEAVEDIIRRTAQGEASLYPLGSPDVVAKGVLNTADLRTGIYGPLGRWFPIEKRPLQGIRSEFGVAPSALEAAAKQRFAGAFGEEWGRVGRKIKGGLYEDIMVATGHEAPQMVAFYAKPGEHLGYAKESLAEVLSPEEMAIRKNAGELMTSERVVQKEIFAPKGFNIRQEILAAKGKVGELRQINPLQGFLGLTAGGEEVWAEAGKNVTREAIGAETMADDMLRVYMKETHEMGDDAWKVFSEESKHVATLASNRRMKRILRRAGVQETTVAGQQIQAVLHAGRLEKNLGAMTMQQIEAMSMHAGYRLTTKQVGTAAQAQIRDFLRDPAAALGVTEKLTAAQAGADLELQRRMVGLAKGWGFTEKELGETFGLLGAERAEALGIAKEVRESRGVVGLFKGRLGHLAYEQGAGKMAKLDPAGYRVLAMKNYGGEVGDIGTRMVAELAARTPGKGELIPIETMYESLLGQQSFTDRAKAAFGFGENLPLLRDIPEEQLIGAKGRWVGLGEKVPGLGADRFYIPGREEAPGLFKTSVGRQGRVIASPTESAIRNLQYSLKRGEEADIKTAAKELLGTVGQARALQTTSFGEGILGSVRLAGTRRGVNAPGWDVNTWGISREHGLKMFEQMEAGADEATRGFLAHQKKKFLNREAIEGVIWRPPETGPESVFFGKLRMDTNLSRGMISAPAVTGTFDPGTGKKIVIDASSLVGLKGDFDLDYFHGAIVGNKENAARIRRGLGKEIDASYSQYLHDHYAIKGLIETAAGKETTNIADLTESQRLLQGYEKLTAAKTKTGNINLALQKLKLGVGAAAPEKYRPLADIFFHMEEAAISGKHGMFSAEIYKEITGAVKNRDRTRMAGALEKMLGSSQVVKGSLEIAGKNIEGLRPFAPNYQEMSNVMMESLAVTEKQVESAYNMARMAKKGASTAEINKLTEDLFISKLGTIDPAQAAFEARARGAISKTALANRGLRQAATTMSKLKILAGKAKGPALIGAAAAGAIMMAAPSVSGTIPRPVEGPAGGRNVTPDAFMQMPQGPGITPPEPRILAPKKVYEGIDSAPLSARASMRTHMDDANARYSELMTHARGLSDTGRVRIGYKDDRSILDPDMLANKIHQRL